MPLSQYSVIQVVPDAVRDERINVGIMLVCPELHFAAVRMTSSSQRLRQLAPEIDPAVLGAVRADLQHQVGSGLSAGPQIALPWTDAEEAAMALKSISAQYANVVQLTEPRGASADDPAALLDRLATRYLVARAPRPRTADRRRVRNAVRRELEAVGLREWLHRDFRVPGRHDEYVFDLAIANGAPSHLVTAMSLAREDKSAVRNDLFAHAWQIDDIRQAGFKGAISIVAQVEPAREDLARLGRSILADLGGQFVSLVHVRRWAQEIAAV